MAEAASAARYRAYAERAESEGLSQLAARWIELAVAKDRLARELLEAAGQVREPARAVADALAEERYENDVLYPKMTRDVAEDVAVVLRRMVEAQRGHVERLEALRGDLAAAAGRDVA
jgi:rubrerythrin